MIIHMKAFLKFAKYQKVKWGTHAKHELWRKSRIQFLAKKPMCDLSDLTKDGFYLAGLTADNCPPYLRLGTQPVPWLPKGVAVKDASPLVATRTQSAFFCILRPKTAIWAFPCLDTFLCSTEDPFLHSHQVLSTSPSLTIPAALSWDPG